MDSPPEGVVQASPELAEQMAPDLAAAHIREILDTAGLSPSAALALSLEASLEAYAFVPPRLGRAVLMMGVETAGLLHGGAVVWMLGTEEMSRNAAGVLRAVRWGVERAFAASGADYLEQFIPEWYHTGIRFVRRLGFSISPSSLHGRSGSRLRRALLIRRRETDVQNRPSPRQRRRRPGGLNPDHRPCKGIQHHA